MTTDTPAPTTRRRAPWHLLLLIIFAIILVLPLCTFQVRKEQVAIKTTFGRSADDSIGPGLHWKWPWPIQKVHVFDQRLRVFVSTFNENYTSDNRNLVITFFAAWRIAAPDQFLESFASPAEAEAALASLISAEKNVVIGRHPIAHLVSTNQEELRYAEIEAEILTQVSEQAMSRYGIEIAMLGIERLGLPETTVEAVFQRMITERQNRAQQIVQEGRREASSIEAAANQQREDILSQARAESKAIRGEGDAAAAQIYEELDQHNDREFALFLRQLEALEETLASEKTTIVIDRNMPPFDLLKGDWSADQQPAAEGN